MTEESSSLQRDKDRGSGDPTELEQLVEQLADSLFEHPGFMWTDSGFEVLHADWPAYPLGRGKLAALYTLADHPQGTEFWPVDNIDACTLLAIGRKPESKARRGDIPHVAVWDQDLRTLAKSRLVHGVSESADGFLEFPDGCVDISGDGAQLALLYELIADVHPSILERVETLLEVRRYDSAVRDASIMLEHAIKALVPESAHLRGKQLIDKVFAKDSLVVPGTIPNPRRLLLKDEFMKFFVYVRNELAHNLSDIDVLAASRYLRRCSKLLRVVEALRARQANSESAA